MTANLPKKERCSGCQACKAVCPARAIRMRADAEGFLYPETDKALCRGCGRCVEVCPALHVAAERPLAYIACRHKDEDVRAASSSGGVFPALARHVLAGGGARVYGARYDSGARSVRHVGIDRLEDLPPLQGSKYAQSDLGDIPEEIRARLRSGRVLFTGTPCQTACVRRVAGSFTPNLLTMDVVCYGVMSPELMRGYLDFLGGASDLRFRDKSSGQGSRVVSYVKDGQRVFSPYSMNPLMLLYSGNRCLRPVCHACPYASTGRNADLSIGDFHDAGVHTPALEDGKGVSLLLVNSPQGQRIWEEIRDNFLFAPITEEQARQPRLQCPTPASPLRAECMRDFATRSFAELASRHSGVAAARQAVLQKIRGMHNA